MNSFFRNCFIYCLILLFGLQIATGQDKAQPAGSIPLEDIRLFAEIFAKIKSDYVEQIDDKELLENAIRGMLGGLDPHSSYMDAESYANLKEGTAGEFGGLGIEVGMEDGLIKVVSPIDDTPAQRAGIKAGDLIIKLDDQSVRGMSLDNAVKIMRGEAGEPITLTVIRASEEKPLVVTIVRDIIKIRSVRTEVLEPGFGYLRISSFQARTVDSLKKAIDQLKKDSGGLQGVILDLRNNPGGVLTAAVGVSDMFLNKGMILYTEGRVRDSSLKFNARPNAKLGDLPLVVLVNEGSASASEIVAGAIQDHKRGVIVGGKTFGKGSVQTILPIKNSAALKLTTARYYTPLGRSIQASGIEPDIIIDKLTIAQADEAFDLLDKEANLGGHLKNDQDKTESPPAAKPNETPGNEATQEDEIPLSVRDYELYEALNILKGLVVMAKNRTDHYD